MVLGGAAQAAPEQAPHKALYTMVLASSKSTTVVNVQGEMYYDFADSCDAWTTNQKFTLNYVYADQPEEKLNNQYTSHEAKSGGAYDFVTKRTKNGSPEEEYVGSAVRNADGSGQADYTQPDRKTFQLPKGFLFPTQHNIALLQSAMKHDHIFNARMFDGSDGQGALEVNVVVSDVIQPVVDAKFADNPLLKSPAHKVRLAYYPPADEKGENQGAEPDYEMTMILHENGVVSSMQIDYDQFSLKGDLQALEPGAEAEVLRL